MSKIISSFKGPVVKQRRHLPPAPKVHKVRTKYRRSVAKAALKQFLKENL